MERRPRIAVFASGSGSNFQALVDAFQAKPAQYGGDIALLVCDRPQAYVVKRAEDAGVPAACFTPKAYASREQYEEDVLLKLREERIDWIVLAGYMRLVTPVLLSAYGGRMINVHPSLLPAFPGLNAVKQALDYGVRVTGITVHLVDEGMDTGPILAQQVVLVEENDTEETLAARIHAAEHELYPSVVAEVVAGKLSPSRV
ncbi:phosphoribosylglycinamide formyltransferase [Paenibacillus sp. SC116]|uniref:phosphoribosylglycinamide formyltransferase n=1 Tax=Paenibacillus sp. SC116 TaxID=2968986 RepID=UPI00215AAA35|nr:phosphoribosylglycinamide formyltransferase [Paenibacillus sp. SC116]MCR8846459.1 phosphoribosylglycinamide formyltransferase [Paenibacillus sp. SC116]